MTFSSFSSVQLSLCSKRAKEILLYVRKSNSQGSCVKHIYRQNFPRANSRVIHTVFPFWEKDTCMKSSQKKKNLFSKSEQKENSRFLLWWKNLIKGKFLVSNIWHFELSLWKVFGRKKIGCLVLVKFWQTLSRCPM